MSSHTSVTMEVRLGINSWMVSSIRAVVIPQSRGQLMWRTKWAVYTRRQSISRKPSMANSGKCAILRTVCSDSGPRCAPRVSFTACITAWLRSEDSAPVCNELRKIYAIQASSATVKITRNAISHALVFSVCIKLLIYFIYCVNNSSVKGYYNTPALWRQ